MKKTLFFLMALVMLAACGNDPKTQDPEQKNEPTETTLPDPTSLEIRALVECIPDHFFDVSTVWAFTEDYYALLKEAWAVPSDGLGEIGSDEWLYYFVTGQDSDDTFGFQDVVSVNTTGETSYVVFEYKAFEIEQHRMILKHENDGWKIADFDDTRIELINYIKQQREYFRSEDWPANIKEVLSQGWLQKSDIDKYQKEIEDYFREYPDDVTGANFAE